MINNCYEQLVNQIPIGFIINKNNKIYPIYLLENDKYSYYISYYIRQIILYCRIDYSKIYSYYDDINREIYCYNGYIINNLLDLRCLNIMYDWIYDLLQEFRKNYNFYNYNN